MLGIFFGLLLCVIGLIYMVQNSVAQTAQKKARTHNLLFGCTLDLSRGLGIFGSQWKKGIMIGLQKLQELGGINGQIPKIIFLDDKYTPKKARENVEQFLNEYKIDILFSPTGSPTLEKYLDLVEKQQILVLFPGTGAPIFRKPDLKYMIHFRPSYVNEGKILARYALEHFNPKRVAIFYQDDAFGKGPLHGAQEVLGKSGNIEIIPVPYARNTLSFSGQAKKITQINPDTIIFSSIPLAARELMKRIGITHFTERNLLGISDFGEAVFRKFNKEKGLGFIIVNVTPNPETSDLEIVKEYREMAKKNNVAIDMISLEGYINSNILVHILKQIKGAITKEKIIEIAENIKNYNLNGLILNFNPQTRELSNKLWLDTGKEEWEEIAVS